jgi:hypothetical protein
MASLVALAVALLPAAATDPAGGDIVIQADGTELHGRVLSCGDGVRFVPVGSAEVLLEAEAIRAVHLRSGEPCPLVRKRSNLAGGIAAMVVLPVVGFFVGGAIASAGCHDDRTLCSLNGAAIGAGAGLVVGSTVLIATVVQSNEHAPATASRVKRPIGLSLAIRF